jgi:C-terminal processing protease CtpA/Prc
MVAESAGSTNLYAYSLDELATARPVARQLTTSRGRKADPQFSPDSSQVYYLDGGRIQIANVESRQSRALAVTAELTVDLAADRVPVFRQAWTLLRDNFFDPDMNGVDWNESRHVYEQRAAAAATGDELRRIISLMIGDLNASHLGISRGGGGGSAIGRLGLTFDRREYESAGRFRITGVVPLGPAALTQQIEAGQYLLAVNGETTGAGVNLNQQLANTIGRRVVVSVAPQPDGPAREVVLRPANQSTTKGLLYRWWVERNREYVLKASGGRFGYVHMVSMSAGALDQLHVDLDSENHARDGLVIDLRNNNGGFVNGYALDVFARQSYLRMSTRNLPEAPARAILGQRALELSTILVTNQHSLSDAEDFTEGYRALELGSVVGEPTAGWIGYRACGSAAPTARTWKAYRGRSTWRPHDRSARLAPTATASLTRRFARCSPSWVRLRVLRRADRATIRRGREYVGRIELRSAGFGGPESGPSYVPSGPPYARV